MDLIGAFFLVSGAERYYIVGSLQTVASTCIP